MSVIRELIKPVLQGIRMAAIIIIFTIMPVSPALARPAAPERYQAADTVFSSNPDQDANWVLAQAIDGGCNPDGTCRGNEQNASGLYEYKPDRELREREPLTYIGDRPPSPDLSKYPHAHRTASNADRDYCYNIVGGRTYYFGWARGTWHHGAYWSYSAATGWSGPNNPHWAFWHRDQCDPPDPTSTPTPTQLPTATVAPRQIRISVWQCSLGQAPAGWAAYITAWTGDWSRASSTNQFSQAVPGAFSQVSYHVALADGWSAPNGNSHLSTALPASIDVVAFNSAVCNPQPVTSTPTSGPPGCPGWTTWQRDASLAVLAPHRNGLLLSTDPDNPTVVLPAGGSTFQFIQDKRLHRDANGDDRAEFFTYLELYNPNGQHIASTSWAMRRDVDTWGGVTWNLVWSGIRTRKGISNLPDSYFKIPRDGLAPRTFDTDITLSSVLVPGMYRIYVRSNGDRYRQPYPCPSPYREQSFFFLVSAATPTPTPTATATATTTPTLPPNTSPTRTSSPTRTPTPLPPPPPVASPGFRLRIHSAYDPQHKVYLSERSEITWPMGEVLDWTPAIELGLPPDNNPNYNFRARVLSWSYVSSLGYDARYDQDALGRQGCRTRAEPAKEPAGGYELAGCSYRYLDQKTVSEADMLGQAHSFWSAFLPRSMSEPVYVYQLPQLQPADLQIEVKILVEVLNASSGAVVAQATQIEAGSYKVNFSVPRSAR